MTRLRDLKSSNLIRHALRDLEAAEKDPYYSVFMYEVHSASADDCEVNLPGAVMAKSLGIRPDQSMDISQVQDENHRAALLAISYF